MTSKDTTSNQQAPSLVASHANYAVGVAKEAMGGLTGSEEWKSGGQHDKDAAVRDMRAANDVSGDQQGMGGPRVGKLEESLGSAVGCEGMVSEGQTKQHKE